MHNQCPSRHQDLQLLHVSSAQNLSAIHILTFHSEASATPGYWNPVAPAEGYSSSAPAQGYASSVPAAGTGAYSSPVSPYATTSAPIAAYTGAANRVANVGAGLAGVAAAAAFLL